ncbi:MAG: hypothetical protein KC468_17925 [Myxococcales bacterium]|nr:hypothetical protein [Myxococcales bacterium]
MLADWTTAPVTPRQRAGLRLVELLTTRPRELDAATIAELRAAGLDDAALDDAANVTFHFNFINRLADAFDFPRLDADQRRRLARMLDRASRVAAGARPQPSYARGEDGLLRPAEVELGRAHALSCAGGTAPALRRAAEAHAARVFGATRSAEEDALPEPARGYVEKLARWAYRIIDEDIDALKAAGYDEEQIFELTFAGALGASVVALERLFAVLHGPAARGSSDAPGATSAAPS